MGFWNLLADVDAIELLIRIGIVVVFMVGPYLLQLLGGKAVQDDRGQRRRREPQSDLEREIQDFLEQSRSGGNTSSSRVPAQSVEDHDEEEFVQAESAHETLKDHHLESKIDAAHPEANKPAERQPYATDVMVHQEHQYEESENYNYDSDASHTPTGAGASIAAMFRDPGQVRNAFILGEIMSRPKIPRR
ncbi:hypothetical protein C5Y96_13905 [Blastopirellula marina]|uniref:Uncharacterized protein n=1 Tax=Blastopirellula marina TaxID=124 RepID=A0A2S8FEG0_9BACT|nr:MULTISPECIES: hypothetical protein [Pirellulaceae]PQO30561.1 hypothetical protein C5Y96_13905 [Blastopirellula marina]RCS50698.1 hypothetical protein DTL36_13915 [Bremerella cremea]